MWRKQQRFSNYNISSTASGLLQAFAITSDPQFPWTPCSDNSNHPSCPENDNTKYQVSEELIRNQYHDINNYMAELPSSVNGAVLINGDITAYGHNDLQHPQWTKAKVFMNSLNRPYYFGLGNHDLDNDCYNQGCFKNSLNFLIKHVEERRISSNRFDYTKTFLGAFQGYKYEGSFAYSFDIGNICFIQLQHTDTFLKSVPGSITGNTNTYTISPNINFFEEQLQKARDSGKIIIVNVHAEIYTSVYQNLLNQYGVVACFSGHYHLTLGRSGSFGGIPNFRSGSASQRTYLILEQYVNRLEIYTVRDNNWRNRQLVHTIFTPISGNHTIVSAISIWPTTKVLDRDPNNNNIHLWKYEGQNNAQWNFRYEQSKDAYVIRNISNQNLVLAWNDQGGSKNVFANPFVPTYEEHYWIIEPFQNGYVFKNKKQPNLVLSVDNTGVPNGTNISVRERLPVNTSLKDQTFLICGTNNQYDACGYNA
ncbi:metallophosphoesterase [Bacillus mycoides]|uniref:metallophosphoesterase n=1 Tax=Bacillus mycoides TaxID=1405 RepID=UPI003D07AC3C